MTRRAAPGPWSIVDNRSLNGALWIEAIHPEGFGVSIAEVRQGCGEADDISTVEANARLIAAGPALHAALKALVGIMNNPYDGGEYADGEIPALDQARAALALAEGREP